MTPIKPNHSKDSRIAPGRKTDCSRAPGSDAKARPIVVIAVLLAGLLAVLVPLFLFPRAQHSTAPQVNQPAETRQQKTPASAARMSPSPMFAPSAPKSVEEQWGIEITGIRVALGGNGLDMRYKVVDPGKATGLPRLREQTYIVDQASGKTLALPFQRQNQTPQKLLAGKTYFTLLPNHGQLVQPGDKVTVAIGQSQKRDVTVE